MKTSREQFDEWFRRRRQAMQVAGVAGHRIAMLERRMYEAWQASRQCIEVELPERISSLNMHNGSATTESTHYDDAIDDCEERIKIAGIKVKGA